MKPVIIHTSISDEWHPVLGIATREYDKPTSIENRTRRVADGFYFFGGYIKPFFGVEIIYDRVCAEYYVPVVNAQLMMTEFQNDSRGLWAYRGDELRAILESLGH